MAARQNAAHPDDENELSHQELPVAAIDPALTRRFSNLDHSYESIDRLEAKFAPELATPIAKYLGDVLVTQTGASWMATPEPEVGKLPYLGKAHFVPDRAVASFAALRIPGDLRENTERYDLKRRRAMVAALDERTLDLDALGKALGVTVRQVSYEVFETIQTTVAPGTKLDLAALRMVVAEGSLLAAELARGEESFDLDARRGSQEQQLRPTRAVRESGTRNVDPALHAQRRTEELPRGCGARDGRGVDVESSRCMVHPVSPRCQAHERNEGVALHAWDLGDARRRGARWSPPGTSARRILRRWEPWWEPRSRSVRWNSSIRSRRRSRLGPSSR